MPETELEELKRRAETFAAVSHDYDADASLVGALAMYNNAVAKSKYIKALEAKITELEGKTDDETAG